MIRKQYCSQCHWFEKSEYWCYQLNNHRKPLQMACVGFQMRMELHMDKAAGAVVVTTAGVCGFVNGCSVNEMLFAIVCILAACLIWQVSVVLWQCRVRRKRIEALLRVRRCSDGKPC